MLVQVAIIYNILLFAFHICMTRSDPDQGWTKILLTKEMNKEIVACSLYVVLLCTVPHAKILFCAVHLENLSAGLDVEMAAEAKASDEYYDF